MPAATYQRLLTAYARLHTVELSHNTPAFLEFHAVRDELFAAIGLPSTGHNTERLYDCADRGLTLRDWLADVDRHLPAFVLADESLLLAALAGHFASRHVGDWLARTCDIEAFMRLPHDGYHLRVIGAWLAGALSFADLRQHLFDDVEALDMIGNAA